MIENNIETAQIQIEEQLKKNWWRNAKMQYSRLHIPLLEMASIHWNQTEKNKCNPKGYSNSNIKSEPIDLAQKNDES